MRIVGPQIKLLLRHWVTLMIPLKNIKSQKSGGKSGHGMLPSGIPVKRSIRLFISLRTARIDFERIQI